MTNMEDFGDIQNDIITAGLLNKNLPWYSCGKEEWKFTRRKFIKEREKREKRRKELEEQQQQQQKTTTSPQASSSWASIVRGKNDPLKPTNNIPHHVNGTTAAATEVRPVPPSEKVLTTITTTNEVAPAATDKKRHIRKPLGEVVAELLATTFPQVREKVSPRGLINTGNLCFMNSILQVLIYCEPFYSLLQQVSDRVRFNLRNTQSPILDGLIDFVQEFRMNEHDEPFAPESFYKMITQQKRFDHLQRGRQEDAQEFLGYLLEGIHEEFVHALKETNQPIVRDDQPPVDQWIEVGSKKKSSTTNPAIGVIDTPITKLFGGEFQSILKTPKASITNDPFQHVQLDISDDKVASIEDAFSLMSQSETIPYKVSNGQVVNATKQVLFKNLPKVLIVHLKRFIYQGNESRKYSKPIRFGRSLEIPRSCLASPMMNNRYQLFAIVYHHGSSSTAGHYTADVRCYDHQWVNIDDITLEKIDPEKLGHGDDDTKSAYLLFYVKLD